MHEYFLPRRRPFTPFKFHVDIDFKVANATWREQVQVLACVSALSQTLTEEKQSLAKFNCSSTRRAVGMNLIEILAVTQNLLCATGK